MTPEQLAARIVKPLGPWAREDHPKSAHDSGGYTVEARSILGTYRLDRFASIKNPVVTCGDRRIHTLDDCDDAAAQAAAEADYRAPILAALDLSPVLALVEAAAKAEFAISTHEAEQGFATQIGDDLRAVLATLKETHQ